MRVGRSFLPESAHPTERPRGFWHDIFAFFHAGATKRILISVLIGIVSGLGAMAFFFCLEWLRWFFLGYVAGAPAPAPAGEQLVHIAVHTPYRAWLLFLVPVFGGLISDSWFTPGLLRPRATAPTP
jgi:CIC family chloride channel protein